MMASRSRTTLWIIDIVGGCIVTGCIATFLWLTMIQREQTAGEISELQQIVLAARRDVALLHISLDQQAVMLADRRQQLVATGQLPDHPPVEEYFQMLSALAEERHLQVMRQQPLSSRSYPGLMEHRYAYALSGSMPGLTRFLRAIEAADYWADVSYLKFEKGTASSVENSDGRLALLTISLFSAPPMEAGTDRG